LEYEEDYKDKSVYYGEKADELVEKRVKVSMICSILYCLQLK